MKGYKKGTLLEEYFLNPHFEPTEEEAAQLREIFPPTDLPQCEDVSQS